MAALDDLLGRIQDLALRDDIERELGPLRGERELGLVFERHIPEKVRLHGLQVRLGTPVEVRADAQSSTWQVVKLLGEQAHLRRRDASGAVITEIMPVDSLVAVREFGQRIYPGLCSVGRIERGGDKPFHAVINAENYHALETLLYTCEGKVDCIYIDPPYNTGARDWKYNNDYVDRDDRYRHSKWLSMMDKRLRLAKQLLNADGGVLIVTIDEKEYLRLGMLLEQIFNGARIQMISSLVNPALQSRPGAFGRSDEYVFFVMQGDAAPKRTLLSRDWVSDKGRTFTGTARWDLLRRSGTNARRADRPRLFYPIFVEHESKRVIGAGDSLPLDADCAVVANPEQVVSVWPIRKDGSDGNWQLRQNALLQYVEQGRVRLGGSKEKGYVVYYLKAGEYDKVLNGEYPVSGRNSDGSLIIGEVEGDDGQVVAVPSTQWRIPSHDATQYGSRLLKKFLPDTDFPFPKSLYAVRDIMSFFLSDKPDALIVDFFAGSGTTLHAGMLLNADDDGRRRVILVTNNDVGDTMARHLNKLGHYPGDEEFERHGIFQSVTKPRIEAAATGTRPDGTPVKGDYLDGRPMSDGFEENVEFLKLTYEDPDSVQLGAAFAAIAPLLWLMAGAVGPCIDQVSGAWCVPNGTRYGVLADTDEWPRFMDAVSSAPDLTHAFIVTDSDAVFQRIAAELPETATPVRLYESYLRSFAINIGGRA